jgi:hypothetical protein
VHVTERMGIHGYLDRIVKLTNSANDLVQDLVTHNLNKRQLPEPVFATDAVSSNNASSISTPFEHTQLAVPFSTR